VWQEAAQRRLWSTQTETKAFPARNSFMQVHVIKVNETQSRNGIDLNLYRGFQGFQ
jgi:hypothetical protein